MASVIVGPVDVFDPRFDFRVIPVNCLGKMGAGLAKEAARRYRDASAFYKRTFGDMKPGNIYWARDYGTNAEVLFATTKYTWREASRGSWAIGCAEGLAIHGYIRAKPFSVAVPALGCGLGGLSWDDYGRALASALRLGPDLATFHLSPPH